MQSRLAFGQGRPESLAIQGNDIPWNFLPDIPDPGQEAFAEGARLDQQEYPIERIGTGDAVRQRKEGRQPGFLTLAKPVDVLPTVGSAEFGEDGNEQDVEQDMPPPPDLPRVGQSCEMACKAFGLGPHGLNLHGKGFATSSYKVQEFIKKYFTTLQARDFLT